MWLQLEQVLVGLFLLHADSVSCVDRLFDIRHERFTPSMIGVFLHPLGQLVKEDGPLEGKHLLGDLRVLVHRLTYNHLDVHRLDQCLNSHIAQETCLYFAQFLARLNKLAP